MSAPAADRTEQFRALFDPKGVVVAGASTHPGKFGFVALHNILANGYQGDVFATNRDGSPVLGIDTVPSVADVPAGAADLVFVCTPASTNPDVLRAAAAKGIRAAFLASAGYGEAGEEGRRAQDELVALADELGVLIVGPNGQGVVSTPSSLCAQIVAPYPPPGRIGIASQSGNFVSSFMNYACASGVGISRAVSAGNAAMVGVTDFLSFYADDPATDVALAYVEGIEDGRRFLNDWGEQASALGWTARDLFGLHALPDKPALNYRRLSRYDETGLIWLLQGRPVVALTESSAAIENPSRAVTVYRKNNKPTLGPMGDSLDDFDPWGRDD
jgi:succinyl-CoA synthetase alpha subunit